MVIRFFLTFILIIILVAAGLYLQSHNGRYNISYLSGNKHCSVGAILRPETIRNANCLHHFSTEKVPFKEYVEFLSKYGKNIGPEYTSLWLPSDSLVVAIEDKFDGNTLYAGKISGLDESKRCGIFIKDASRGLCQPELHQEISANYGKLNFRKYKNLLMTEGRPLESFAYDAEGYDEINLAKGSVDNESLFISSIVYHDPALKCEYMVRNASQFICSASFFQKIIDDVRPISEGKWSVKIFK